MVLAQITSCAKIALTQAWIISRKSWDEDILQKQLNKDEEKIRKNLLRFHEIFLKNLRISAKWEIPRYIFAENCSEQISDKDLILFTDAGIWSKCHVLYLRCRLDDNSI